MSVFGGVSGMRLIRLFHRILNKFSSGFWLGHCKTQTFICFNHFFCIMTSVFRVLLLNFRPQTIKNSVNDYKPFSSRGIKVDPNHDTTTTIFHRRDEILYAGMKYFLDAKCTSYSSQNSDFSLIHPWDIFLTALWLNHVAVSKHGRAAMFFLEICGFLFATLPCTSSPEGARKTFSFLDIILGFHVISWTITRVFDVFLATWWLSATLLYSKVLRNLLCSSRDTLP